MTPEDGSRSNQDESKSDMHDGIDFVNSDFGSVGADARREDMMIEMLSKPLVVVGHVQDYAWGMGADALVHKLSGEVTENGKYAELWFGSHPNGEARIVGTEEGMTLSHLATAHGEEFLGSPVVAEYGNHIPFLFKILSVGSALSIQTHPDEAFAKVLHSRDPEHYADSNPKPEVGIALSPVELLYGFRSMDDICRFIAPGDHEVPELVDALGEKLAALVLSKQAEDSEALEKMYRAVMELAPERTQALCQSMYQRISEKPIGDRSPEEVWIETLQETYPDGDVGMFSMYLLNLVTVPEGKGLFIGPNIPHAYLKNELAECMAPSDNVVRAGLTPKYIDIETLLGMLKYSAQAPELLDPVTIQDGYGEYPVPLEKYFKIGVMEEGSADVHFHTDNKIELIVATGEATLRVGDAIQKLHPGQAAFIPALVESYSILVKDGKAFRVRVP